MLARSRTRRWSGESLSSRAATRACSDAGAPIWSRSSRWSPARTYCPPRGTTRSRSISERTVSTAKSGMPSARDTSASRTVSSRPATRPSRSWPICRGREGVEVDDGRAPVGGQAGVGLEQPGPGEEPDEAGERREREQVLDEEHQAVVGVLRVVDQQHHRRLLAGDAVADPVQEGGPGREQVLARERADRADAEQGGHPRLQPGPLVGVGHQPVEALGEQLGLVLVAGGVLDVDALVVVAQHLQPAADRLGQRVERHALAVRQAAAGVPADVGAQAVDVLLELPGEPGLAEPGVAVDDEQRRALGLLDPVEELLDQPHLAVAPDVRRLEPVGALGAADRRDDRAHRPQRASARPCPSSRGCRRRGR